jgi:preprotein translocase subunit YajC
MSGIGFLVIIVAFGFLWFVLVRPQKKRRVDQERMLSAVSVGDEVLTVGGIYGTVATLDDDEVGVEIAPGLRVRVARRAIAGVVEADDDEDETPDEPADEDEEAAGAVAESPVDGNRG